MKDNRFIDLVNLYIDRQISAAETAELEAEIQANPRRRAIYKQYCQMHRATTLVYESFRANAPETQAAGEGTIAHFERERRTSWGYYAAGLAAAACVALVFVQLNARKAAEASLLAKADSLPAVTVAAVPPRAVSVAAPVTVEPKAGLVSLRNRAATEQDYAAQLTGLRLDEPAGALPAGRLPSLFDDEVFESRPVMPLNNPRVFRSKQSPQQQAEFTAFQFQR